MKLRFWTKAEPIVISKAIPRVYSEQEQKEIDENRAQVESLRAEMASWPQVADMVKIRLNGRLGQVIDSSIPAPPRWDWNAYTITGDEVIDSKSESFMYRLSISREKLERRYEIRLKNGMIVGNLRYWEIEKVKTK